LNRYATSDSAEIDFSVLFSTVGKVAARGGGQIMPDIYRQRQGDNGRRKQKSRPPLASRGQVQKRDDRFRAANYFMTR
jgi:hypothetical protein